MSKNGQAHYPSLFCVIVDRVLFMPYEGVIAFLEANAAEQAKTNLAMGPIIREICDKFRKWGKFAEQGWACEAHEINLRIIRMSITRPTLLSSEGAIKKMQRETDPNTRPSLIVED